MKSGKYAIYLGKEYRAGRFKDRKIILHSTNIRDVENGFMMCEPFKIAKSDDEEIVCQKIVNHSDVDEYYVVRTKAVYAEFEFEVVDEKDNKLSIVAMTGDYKDWQNMGMKCIDKGVYQKWINKEEAEIKIIKERY